LHRLSTESSNVGKESFDTSKAKKYATQTSPSFVFVSYKIFECVVWVEGFENSIVVATFQ